MIRSLYCLLDPQLVRFTPPLISFRVCCQEYCGGGRGGALGGSTIAHFVWQSRWACVVDAVTCVLRRRGGRGKCKRVISSLPEEYLEDCFREEHQSSGDHQGAHSSEWACDRTWNGALPTRFYPYPHAFTREGDPIRQVELEIC